MLPGPEAGVKPSKVGSTTYDLYLTGSNTRRGGATKTAYCGNETCTNKAEVASGELGRDGRVPRIDGHLKELNSAADLEHPVEVCNAE